MISTQQTSDYLLPIYLHGLQHLHLYLQLHLHTCVASSALTTNYFNNHVHIFA